MNRPDWFQAEEALQQIQVIGSDRNELVNIIGDVEGLNCIGTGTDAAVFTYDGLPGMPSRCTRIMPWTNSKMKNRYTNSSKACHTSLPIMAAAGMYS